MKETAHVPLYVLVPPTLKAKAVRLAKKSDQSVAQWLRKLIREAK